jgi:hypothetical protein
MEVSALHNLKAGGGGAQVGPGELFAILIALIWHKHNYIRHNQSEMKLEIGGLLSYHHPSFKIVEAKSSSC